MSRPTKLLTVAPQPFFSPRGTPLSVYYRTLALSELGVEVDLLTYGEGEEIDLAGVRVIRIPRFRWLGPVKVGPSLLKLFLDGFLFLWAVALLGRNRYDAVLAHEESVFFCRFLKPFFGFKLVYEMHSSLPRQLESFGFDRPRLLVRWFERLERGSLAAADAVVTISPELAEHAAGLMPDPQRQFLIENSLVGPVRLKYPPDERAVEGDWARQLPAGAPIVAYAGTFESYQGLELLLAAFRILCDSVPDAFLLLIGGNSTQVETHRRTAGRFGILDRCLFTGPLPGAVTRLLLERAAVLTSPRGEGTQTPLKVYEVLAGGKPLVATRIPAHTQVLSDRVCFLSEPDPSAFAAALREALLDPDRAALLAAEGRSLYDTHYSKRSYMEKIERLIEALG